MMSPGHIQAENTRRAAAASHENQTPFVFFDEREVQAPFPFPHLGDHRPDGWELFDTHFVDSSGFGAPDEPALTAEQFLNVIRRRIAQAEEDEASAPGWAVIEAGQFQVHVGEFIRTGEAEPEVDESVWDHIEEFGDEFDELAEHLTEKHAVDWLEDMDVDLDELDSIHRERHDVDEY